MVQQGQTIELTRRGLGGERLWAYRYRTGGRDSKRVQRGGFASEQDARDALERELERLRRERRIARRLTLHRTRRDLSRAARRATGDDREAPLPAQQGDRSVRRSKDRRVDLAGDRRVADAVATRLPLRGNAGAPAGAPPGGRLGNDRRQPGQGRRRQPGPEAQGAAPVRIVGRAGGTRYSDRATVRANDPVRGRDRVAPGRVDRTRETRRRPGRACRLRAPLVHAQRAEVPEDGGEHARSSTPGAGARRA